MKKVVIIGAGIAGLTAARELNDEFEVLILEAAGVPGGRCRTIEYEGNILELGAGFMQGSISDNPFASVAAQHGLQWSPSESERTVYYNGKKLSEVEQTAITDYIVAAPEQLQQSNYTGAVSNFYDTRKNPLEKIALQMLAGPAETGCELSALSVHDVADQHETGEFATITSGWHEFLKHYSAGLNIIYNCAVGAVNYIGDQIQITAPEQNFTADYVIVTTSIGVLNSNAVQFTPPLPPEQTQALGQLQMGLLNKYFFAWHRAPALSGPIYWEKGDARLEIWPHDNANIWLIVVGGDWARALEHMPPDDAVSALLDQLSDFNPACKRDNLKWHYATAWMSNGHTQGAYSALRPDGDAETRIRAGQPIADKIFFAGEAFDIEYATTIVGAYRSGRRAAEAIKSP